MKENNKCNRIMQRSNISYNNSFIIPLYYDTKRQRPQSKNGRSFPFHNCILLPPIVTYVT